MDRGNYSCRSPQSPGSLTPGNLRDSLDATPSGRNGSPGASDQQRRPISLPPGQNGNSSGGAHASAMHPSLIAGNPSDRFASLAPYHQRQQMEDRCVSLPPAAHNYSGVGGPQAPTSRDIQRRSHTLSQFQSLWTGNIRQLQSLLGEQPPSAPPTPASPQLASHGTTTRKSGGETVHYPGDVALTRHTGVPAIADNSPLDALFMCLSYNRLSDVITDEIGQRLSDDSRDSRAMEILEALREAFNTIEFDRKTGTPLPSDHLHRLRAIYPLDNPDNLNPTTIIKYLLNDIYGHTGCPTHTHLFDQTDLCRPVAFLDIISDRILINSSEEESENLNKKIIPLTAPFNFPYDKEINSEAPSPSNPNIVICEDAYFKDDKLILRSRFQKEWSITPGTVPPEYTTYCASSWLEDKLNCRFRHYECDVACQIENNLDFLRSLTVTQTDDMAVTTVTEKKMSGYNSQTPNKGLITTRNYRRATNVNEMISAAWLERIKAERGDRMAQWILPEQDECPQVLIAALPEYRAEQQINIDWQLDVHLPTSSGDSKTPYILSALISREKSHCLAWFFDRERRLLHCADTRGTTDPEGNAIPVQVTSPYPDSGRALMSAGLACSSPEQQAIFDATSQRIDSLGKEACLLIYQKSPYA